MRTNSNTSLSSSGKSSIAASIRRASWLRDESALPGGAATPDSARTPARGRSSKRRARSLSCQRMCWLARAKNWRTVWGRTVRSAVSSPATTPSSSSSVSKFKGGCVEPWVAPMQERSAQQAQALHCACQQVPDERFGGRVPLEGVQTTLNGAGRLIFIHGLANLQRKGVPALYLTKVRIPAFCKSKIEVPSRWCRLYFGWDLRAVPCGNASLLRTTCGGGFFVGNDSPSVFALTLQGLFCLRNELAECCPPAPLSYMGTECQIRRESR